MATPTKTWPKLATVTDRYGNRFTYGNAGDHKHPAFAIGEDSDYRTHIRGIRDMEIRPDDVLICSYPKTGVHWTSEIIRMLVRKVSKNFATTDLPPEFLDMVGMAEVDETPSPRVLMTHVPFRYLPKQAFEKKIKIVRLERNPKDVLVSYYCHMNSTQDFIGYHGSFEQFFRLYFDCGFVYGDMFDYSMEFQEGMERHPDVDIFTSVFEDMKQNPLQSVMKLNEFLETGCTPELCCEIVKACSFDHLKPFKDATMPEHRKETHTVFYRKGKVGDWKNWFTVAMNEEFDKEYEKRMSGYKLKYKYIL